MAVTGGNMDINASICANFFLKKAEEEEIPLTLMKLLKIVYIAHGWSLAILNKGILGNEKVEAWQHGPVISSLYHEFKHFKETPISDWSQSTEETDIGFEVETLFLENLDIANKDTLLNILQTVWDSYKNYSAWGLREKTHEEGTPWKQSYRKGERRVIIEDSLIQSYYKTFLQNLIETNG